jgi:hypothetical protein
MRRRILAPGGVVIAIVSRMRWWHGRSHGMTATRGRIMGRPSTSGSSSFFRLTYWRCRWRRTIFLGRISCRSVLLGLFVFAISLNRKLLGIFRRSVLVLSFFVAVQMWHGSFYYLLQIRSSGVVSRKYYPSNNNSPELVGLVAIEMMTVCGVGVNDLRVERGGPSQKFSQNIFIYSFEYVYKPSCLATARLEYFLASE